MYYPLALQGFSKNDTSLKVIKLSVFSASWIEIPPEVGMTANLFIDSFAQQVGRSYQSPSSVIPAKAGISSHEAKHQLSINFRIFKP